MNTKQLRQKILDLAIRGKLVPQDPADEPASVLLERIRAEKERLVKEGKIKRDRAKPGTDKRRYKNVPEGWAICTLENICDITSSKRIFANEYVAFGVPFFRTKEIVELSNNENISTELFISEQRYSEIKNEFDVPKKNDILLSAVGTIGISWVVDNRKFYFKDGNLLWIKNTKSNSQYLKYVLDGIFAQIEIRNGSAYSALTIEKLKKITIPFPPLAEQRRIAAAIESAFALIDEIERNKADLQAAVAAAKSKILSLAIRGKLVPQDPADEPAGALLERIRSERENFVKAGKIKRGKGDPAIIRGDDNPYYEQLPESWEICRLGLLCSVVTKGTTPKGGEKVYLKNGIGFIRAENITDSGLILDDLKFINEQTHNSDLKRSILQNNDLLITIAGSLGRVGIVHTEIPLNCNQAVCLARLINTKNISLDFLKYIIKSNSVQRQLTKQTKVTAVPNLTIEIISNCVLPIPPIAEQQRIVSAIEAAFEQLDSITAILA